MENISTETPGTQPRPRQKKYIYMIMLQSLLTKPYNLLNAASLTLKQKKFLLKKWYDDRTDYISDNFTGPQDDDSEMRRLAQAMRDIKDNHMHYN